ncbi:MAG: phosphoglycerate kinase [Candidatus Azambacteria bacterium]|nr:phosphoglycerate kinase [Candidatus Azambacteria bacterium]
MRSIIELTEKELSGKKILLRVDFNVPFVDGKILDNYRIKAHKETIDYLISHGAIITLLSHIIAVDSFEPLLPQIQEILGTKNFSLFENVRKYNGEEINDEGVAKELAKSFNIYINDAFSVSHRNHSSVVAITKFLPSYAGFLLIKEIENLKKVLELPKEGKTLIIGGAKISTKFPVIKNFIDKAENILIGGAIANIFFKASGIDIKKSLTNDSFLGYAKEILKEKNLVIPGDYVISGDMILDIGEKTTDKFVEIIGKSKIVIWNGPLGKTEISEFSLSSEKVVRAIISSGSFSIVGGGDTIAFIEKMGLINKFGYVSTGGGAMLEFLAGKKLPGLTALGYDSG